MSKVTIKDDTGKTVEVDTKNETVKVVEEAPKPGSGISDVVKGILGEGVAWKDPGKK